MRTSPLLIPIVIALSTATAEAVTTPQVGTVPLDESTVHNTTTNADERVKIVLGQMEGSFIHDVPFQSESAGTKGAVVEGRNVSIVSCSPAAVWMLLQATGTIPSDSTFANFITQAGKKRDATLGWTHAGLVQAAQESYGITLEANDFGDPEKYTSDAVRGEMAHDLARNPVGLSIRQIDPVKTDPANLSKPLSETKNTHMIVLKGATTDAQGNTTFYVNDPIAPSETTSRHNANSAKVQARDLRVGVTSWPDEFVKASSLNRWLVVNGEAAD
ncbi:MAG: C39 family peptidase [Candidatus Gracilibacteria bacterium]|jgi:hypothetical protein